MAVFEYRVELVPSAVPAIEDLLAELEQQRLMVIEDKPAGRAWLTGYYESQPQALDDWRQFAGGIASEWMIGEPAMAELADKDWRESYKEHFKAWKFGRLHWVPVWERDSFVLPTGEEVLWLDPGMAFGTGNHETTRLVVERLVALAGRRRDCDRVIDAGCGSGILALSAAKLGYRDIAAFDNDKLAVQVSRENAELNQLVGRVNFFEGDLVSGLAGREAEVVLANIQADVLIRFARDLTGAVSAGGVLVLSGILAAELDQVRRVLSDLVPTWQVDSRVMGEWSDLTLLRP